MKNVLTLLFLVFCGVASGQIINFPDVNFKNALVNTKCVDINGNGDSDAGDADADLNNDGEIDVSEANKVKSLIFKSLLINSFQGLENFINLETFIASGSFTASIKEIDFSKNVNLININYSYFKTEKVNLGSLPKLKFLSLYVNNIETLDLSGCPNITEIRPWRNKIKNLDLSNLKNLTDVYLFENPIDTLNLKGLTKIRLLLLNKLNLKSLELQDQTELENLVVDDNLNLESIFLKSGKAKVLKYISAKNCLNLVYICANEMDINFLNTNTELSQLPSLVINSYCTFTPGGKFYLINGKNIVDFNNNGCDAQDQKVSNFKYNITNGNVVGSFISNSTGNYSIPVQAGTHKITAILEHPNHFEISPSSLTVTFPLSSDTITQDFCITPKGVFRQTNITVIPLSPPARPGFDASYKIVWVNAGNQIENGTLNFTYDETLLDYISATQTADQVADGIVKWNFTNLLPFEKREITITLKVNRPTDTPAVNAGDKLYLTASILDNIFTLENTVVGSYDPNDKTCLQGDRVKPDMVGEYVDYLIRFENTGNYAAENVVVKDIIDTKTFDVSTLKITDASHEVYARIEGNKVEFIFENIQLPFDDANNDGYIAFKIKTLPSLVLGDSLKNLADIYFDYNFPIRTNEAQTTVAFPVFTKDITTEVNIYPNPVTDILYLDTNDHWTKAEIFDISGRIMRSITLVSSSMDVSKLESGTYFIRLKDGAKLGLVKFVKI